ncbi:Elongation of fatty acids protein 2 [Podila verticillata]|nr:Elongation of fatty acids protein 2 [Podila verticillata]
MGVKGLTGLLLRLAPAAAHHQHISHYRGKTLAVDVSCFLNRFSYVLDAQTVYGLDPHPARVQRGLYKLCLFFKQHGIRPILVFDGEDRIIEKYQEGLRRAAQKEKIERSFRLERERKSRLKSLKQSSRILAQDSSFQDIRLFPTQISELELIESEMDKEDKDKDKDTEIILGKGSGETNFNQGTTFLDEEDGDSGKDNKDNVNQENVFMAEKDVTISVKDEKVNEEDMTNPADDDETESVIPETPWSHPSSVDIQARLQDVLSGSKEFYGLGPQALGEEHLDLGLYPVVQDFELFEDLDMKGYLKQLMDRRYDVETMDKTIQQCVHQALQAFVETIETSGQTPDQLHEISNQRQRVLNTLEWELVREIKDILTTKDTPANGDSSSAQEQEDGEGSSTQRQEDGDGSSTHQQEEEGPGAESKGQESETLQSMIQNVFATHQSIFATLERRTMKVTRNLVLSCQELARAMGQPVLEASGAEAEAVCARLVTLGIADATVSEDTDTAVFGDGLLLRQVGVSNKDILEINPIVARESLGLSRDAFRDMCILCGTDFSGTIEGIGPIRAARLIQYYGSIESVMANTDYTPRPTFLYDNARRVFDRTLHVSLDLLEVHQRQEEAQEQEQDQLAELLAKYSINPEEIRKELADENAGKTTSSIF